MKIKERCGVFGIYAFDQKWNVSRFVYYALIASQNRGQETCGIATFNGNEIRCTKGKGMVEEFFSSEKLEKLPGWIGLGNVSPTNPESHQNIQPVSANNSDLVFSYNGKILNYREIVNNSKLGENEDANIAAKLLSEELEKSDPLEATESVMERFRGAYSFVAVTKNAEMIVARDPMGIKPLCIGSFGFDHGAVASESASLDVIGADYKAPIKPGEIYVFTPYSIERKQAFKPQPKYCAFEYVYFSRPDSIINDKSVYEARMKIGEYLAKEFPVDADAVVGVPETAIPFAMAYSNYTGIPIEMGFVRTGRAVRTAIKPTQFERLVGVQLKLNPIRRAIRGKKVVLIDDSVVRGTTTRNIVNLMRNRIGAKEVHVRIGSPRLVSPCPFGVEVPEKDELIAANLTPDEVSRVVGADTFAWLSLEGVVDAIGFPKEKLCLGCFTGEYPLGG
nr:amidophosphoribosyltransferase [Candidatus Freyarchaeota archaeon]